jgi:glycosyltransferase involved in cell wall biosynthesis
MASPPVTVIVGTSFWALNGVNVFSANLVRGLVKRGVRSHVLITENDSCLIKVYDAMLERPADVPFETLPVSRRAKWGAHWGAMVRYLERHAPCVYIPNADFRHSCICPLLSNDVAVIGVVHSDDPLHYDHVVRLGRYWNAITATSPTIETKMLALDPTLSGRTSVIPIGVNLPATPPVERQHGDARLRVIYPGTLKQYQKRVLDFPEIIAAADRLGVPIKMTIAGGGPDEARLRHACADLVERGLVEFSGVVTPERVLTLVEQHDVFLMASEFEGMPNALLEAMGRGCVPLVTQMESGVPDLVQDGTSGCVVPIGDIAAFAWRLKYLQQDAGARRRLSLNAYDAVTAGRYGVDHMVDSYAELIDRVTSDVGRRSYSRPPGQLRHVPAELDGVRVFPVELNYEAPGLGQFPSRVSDYRPFLREIEQIQHVESGALAPFVLGRRAALDRLKTCRIVVAAPIWNRTSTNDYSAGLVRGLRSRGLDAHLLLTEETLDFHRRTPRIPLPADIPVRHLSATGQWPDRWKAMVDYLESRTPCIYLPNLDLRHACVTPLLSDRVMVVGEVHESAFSYNQVERLGRYWNAIVVHDEHDAEFVRGLDETHTPRLHLIERGHELPEELSSRSSTDGSLRMVCVGRFTAAAELERIRLLLDQLRNARVRVDLTLLVQAETTVPLETRLDAAHPDVIVRRFDSVSPDEARRFYDSTHLILCMSSEFDSDWQGLVEAMGRGCVPILWLADPTSSFGRKLVNPDTGYDLTDAAVSQVVDVVARLDRDRTLYDRLRVNACDVAMGCYGTDDVVEDYVELFGAVIEQQQTGVFRRPAGPLEPPPAKINGIPAFEPAAAGRPGAETLPRLFGPEPQDPQPQRAQLDQVLSRAEREIAGVAARLSTTEALLMVNVVVGLPVWTGSYTDQFCARLVRLLRDRGVSAHILVTEEGTALVPHPDIDVEGRLANEDICERLPVEKLDGWGAHWGAMVRYLEERAPCIYLPNHDWRHSGVVPLLSERVMVVGIAHADDPLQQDHVRRLGRFWDAIVVCHPEMTQTLTDLDPSLAPRITFIESHGDSLGDRYEDLFYRVLQQAQRREFERPRAPLQVPPKEVAGAPLFGERIACRRPDIGSFPTLFRDYRAFEREVRTLPNAQLTDRLGPDSSQYRDDAGRLEDVEVVVALPSWTGSGVDEMSLRLVRGLRQEGMRAHILLTEEDTWHVSLPASRPARPTGPGDAELFALLPVGREASWGARWGSMVRYLEERGPCIYIPNHDWRHSCVAPLLSDQVMVIGLLHGDDPFHCDHLRRLGRYWNAIVASHHNLADAALAWDESVSSRLYVIEHDGADMMEEYLELFYGALDAVERGAFRRPRGPLRPPPAEVGGSSVFPIALTHVVPDVGAFPTSVPDYADFIEAIGEAKRRVLKIHTRAGVTTA